MESRDKPLFFVLCIIAVLLAVQIFLFNPPIAIEFKTGAECEQDGWQCVAYRWQTLIGGSFAIFAAAIAWTSLEIQNIRAAKQSREARTRRLRRTLMDMEYLRDTANNIHKCFLAICPNDAGPFNLTHKSIGNCRQNPLPMPRHHEIGMAASCKHMLDTVNTVLTQFRQSTIKMVEDEKHPAQLPPKELDYIVRGAFISAIQLEHFIEDLERDIKMLKTEIQIS
ncbi:hypothetical protein FIV06_24325 [Labrenzia sp. THAF191b]|uniref:hypothetical protein n=1 Tax=unclassified Labrenzia TaxID=2648686 RepID=UPI0012694AF6|nr:MULTISPECIES: hypothetical protein [unclassified Labrenzia]QFT00577.1 hypothetical protein FIV06_24325 [Labrenzia sp. THAF191b]QFT06890.1 hypothetical protein FIV05_24320 [Labrenzia sp. THAF191a]QFT18434.1 hypothetical protein FIV03_24335 [Labrenzia sp. THAF187b]